VSVPTGDMPAQHITLNWRTFAARRTIDENLLRNTVLGSRSLDPVYNSLVLQLSKKVLANTFADDHYTVTTSVPATWWDHWKLDHGRKWLGQWYMLRRPVRLRPLTAVVDVERMHIYPEAPMQHDDRMGRAFIYEDVRGPRWVP
jgi:hypothetical protein